MSLRDKQIEASARERALKAREMRALGFSEAEVHDEMERMKLAATYALSPNRRGHR